MTEAPINIPLTDARQPSWRVARFCMVVASVIATGWLLAFAPRLVAAIDVVPERFTVLVRIEKTPATLALAAGPFRQASVVDGAPWNIAQALTMVERELMLANVDGVWIAFFDRTFTEEETRTAAAFGLITTNGDGWTALGRASIDGLTDAPSHFALGLLRSNAIGIAEDTAGARTTLRYNTRHKAIIADNLSVLDRPTGSLSTTGDDVLVAAAIPPNALGALPIPLTLPGLTMLLEDMAAFGGSLIVGNDETGLRYSLAVPHGGEGVRSAEELGLVGREFVLTRVAKTRTTFLPDATPYAEIRASASTTDVREEDGFLFVDVTTLEDTVRIVSGPQMLTISNDSVAETPVVTSIRICGAPSFAFLRPQMIRGLIGTSVSYQPATPTSPLLQSASLGQRRHELRLCWD